MRMGSSCLGLEWILVVSDHGLGCSWRLLRGLALLGPDCVLVRVCLWNVSYLLLSSSRSGVGLLLVPSDGSLQLSHSVLERFSRGGGAEEAELDTSTASSGLPAAAARSVRGLREPEVGGVCLVTLLLSVLASRGRLGLCSTSSLQSYTGLNIDTSHSKE